MKIKIFNLLLILAIMLISMKLGANESKITKTRIFTDQNTVPQLEIATPFTQKSYSASNSITFRNILQPKRKVESKKTVNREGYSLTTKNYQMFEEDGWNDSIKVDYTYYAENQEILFEEIWSYRENDELSVSGRLRYYYDENENLIEKIWEYYDNEWIFSYKYNYYYNAENQVTSTVYSEWQGEDWLALSTSTTSYNDAGQPTQDFWQYWLDENTLVDWLQNNYLYEDDALLSDTSLLYYDSEWIANYRYLYIYENGNVIQNVYQTGWNNTFNDSIKYIYSWENDNLESTEFYQFYDDWYLMSYASYIYDANNNMLNELWQYEYDGIEYYYSQYEFMWEENVDNNNDSIELSSVKNYPNPFILSANRSANEIIISFNAEKSQGNYEISVFNLKGEKVISMKKNEIINGKNIVRWNGRDKFGNYVSTGCYFYKIEGTTNIGSGKILIIK